MSIEELLKVSVAQLIAWLELAKVISILLNCIICQMRDLTLQIAQRELFAACSQIAFLVVVSFDDTIMRSDKSEAPDVKLSFVNQQGVLYVLLKDNGLVLRSVLINERLDLLQRASYVNSISTVGVLTRLQYPNVLLCFRNCCTHLRFFVFIGTIRVGTTFVFRRIFIIRVDASIFSPQPSLFLDGLLLRLKLLSIRLLLCQVLLILFKHLCIVCLEFLVSDILFVFAVEGQWEHVEGVFVKSIVVLSHV